MIDARLTWIAGAAVLSLLGWEMLLHDLLGWAGWLGIGIGAGIACAVAGSLAHDILAGPRQRY